MQYNLTFRQKDKGWQVIVSYKQGEKWKQRSRQGFSSKKEAKYAADLIIESLKDESGLSDDSSMLSISLKSFLDVFFNDMNGKIRGTSIALYRTALNAFKPIFNEKLRDITAPMVSSCLDSAKIADSTRRMYLARLSRVFVYARKFYKIVKSNPCEQVILKSCGIKRVKVLEPRELDILLGRIGDYNSYAYLGACISAYTGLRLGEVCGDCNGLIMTLRSKLSR